MLLLALAVPLAILGNVARLLLIILAAETFGQSAGGFVHDNSFFSIMPYMPAFGGFWFLTRWLAEPEPVAGKECAS
jgi:exosortase/archaeosortase family protein